MQPLTEQATSHYLGVGGVHFHYLDWGGSGTPIVLLHGLASTVHIWDLVAPLLTAHGHVIALDQRGHGLTSQPTTGYDFATIADDLHSVVNALGFNQFFLVGHSWGAHVALYFAHHHAEHLQGVGLVDGGMMDLKTQYPTWAVAEQQMTPPPLLNKTLADIQTNIKEQWLGDAWTPATGAAALSVYKVAEDGFVQRRLATAHHMQLARAIWEFTPTPYFAALSCPALLAVPLPPGMGQQLDAWQTDKQQQVAQITEQRKDCQVAWFPETIHDIPWQRPAHLAATLATFFTTASNE